MKEKLGKNLINLTMSAGITMKMVMNSAAIDYKTW